MVFSVQVVLAADVVYDREITKHFFKTLVRILETPKVAFLAIEKRQTDPRDSVSVFASNFAYFKHSLDELNGKLLPGGLSIRVTQEKTDFRQFFAYTRVQELTLWRVQSCPPS